MKKLVLFASMALLWSLGAERYLSAQDLVITNARIIVGNGTVIERGSIVIRGGRLASVAAGNGNASAVQGLDGDGMNAMPGVIHSHRPTHTRPTEKQQKQATLDAGHTTIL